MAFAADVVVMDPNVPEIRLVAEIKQSIVNLVEAEQQLKSYMLDRKCSIGLLVTPDHVRLYHDTFENFTPASVELVGEYPTSELLELDKPPSDEHSLEVAVREWLERLASGWPSALPSAEKLRVPVLQYIVPEVAEGRVSSGSLG
jgi:hypothetical protein